MSASTARASSSTQSKVLGIATAGAAVALFLGVYGRVHDPTGETVVQSVFSGQLQFKVWSATLAVALALFQLYSSLWMWGKVGDDTRPAWLGDAHRISGVAAFLFSLPVAYHCLWSLGFAETNTRAVLHSVVGCVFYGAFAAKVLVLRSRGLPGQTLPIVGGLTFAALVLAWLTSSAWFLTNDLGVPIF